MAMVRKSYVWQATSSNALAMQVGATATPGPGKLPVVFEINYDDSVAGIVADLDFYMASIGYVPGNGMVGYDPTVTPTDAPKGSLIVDSSGNWYRKLDDGLTNNVIIVEPLAELAEFILNDEIVVGTAIDGARMVPAGLWKITEVSFYRRTAGLAGTTEVDLMLGTSGSAATTMYTTVANRPKVTAADGNFKQILATLPDVVNVAGGDRLEMNILTAETGTPLDLQLRVVMRRR